MSISLLKTLSAHVFAPCQSQNNQISLLSRNVSFKFNDHREYDFKKFWLWKGPLNHYQLLSVDNFLYFQARMYLPKRQKPNYLWSLHGIFHIENQHQNETFFTPERYVFPKPIAKTIANIGHPMKMKAQPLLRSW